MLSAQRQRTIDQLGESRRNQVWDALCGELMGPFRTSEAIAVIAAELHVVTKTASIYWDALRAYWLEPGNSDLFQLRKGFYDWKPHEA